MFGWVIVKLRSVTHAPSRIVNYLLYVSVYVTVYTLVAVSALRYIVVVCSATKLARVLHRPAPAAVTSAVVWFLSLIGNTKSLSGHGRLAVFQPEVQRSKS